MKAKVGLIDDNIYLSNTIFSIHFVESHFFNSIRCSSFSLPYLSSVCTLPYGFENLAIRHPSFFKGLVAVATLLFCLFLFNTCIQNHIHTTIPYIHPSPFAESSLYFLIALVLSGEKPSCGAEPRIELPACLPASQRATT